MIAETGAVRGKTRRALDSTVLDDAVASQDTVTQLIAAIRRVGREVPGAASGGRGTVHRAMTTRQPGKPRIAWDDQAARDELVSGWSATRWRCSTGSGRERDPAGLGWDRAAGGGAAGAGRRAGRRSPPRTPTAPTGGGGSPAGSPRTG